MVTDAEYKALQARVDDLEKRMNFLARQFNEMYMKRDISRADDHSHIEPKRHKDITKYEVNGELYNKRRLVLVCVKCFVKERNITSYSKLLEAFPDYIQGSLGIVKKVEAAEKYSNANKRFYFSEEDILSLDDGKYVVCSQWDLQNISRFLKLAEDLGFEIREIKRKY